MKANKRDQRRRKKDVVNTRFNGRGVSFIDIPRRCAIPRLHVKRRLTSLPALERAAEVLRFSAALPEDIWKAADLVRARNGQWVRIAGNVICRQQPSTNKGFVFISWKMETGIAIVASDLFEDQRLTLSQRRFC